MPFIANVIAAIAAHYASVITQLAFITLKLTKFAAGFFIDVILDTPFLAFDGFMQLKVQISLAILLPAILVHVFCRWQLGENIDFWDFLDQLQSFFIDCLIGATLDFAVGLSPNVKEDQRIAVRKLIAKASSYAAIAIVSEVVQFWKKRGIVYGVIDRGGVVCDLATSLATCERVESVAGGVVFECVLDYAIGADVKKTATKIVVALLIVPTSELVKFGISTCFGEQPENINAGNGAGNLDAVVVQ